MALFLFTSPSFAAAPYSHTQPATLNTGTSATLNGTVVPNGSPSLAWFEWGARGGFGQTSSPVNVGSGSTVAQVSTAISGLTNRVHYQCRLVVSNASGISYGRTVLFTTGAKVLAWGIVDGYNNGQANVPAGLADVVSLSTGREHSFAILTNGTMVGWGRNDYGQASIPAGLSNVVAVAGSSYTSAAIRSDGSVFAWGDSRTNVPSALTNAVAVAGGLAHLLGLRADGKVFAWGYNSNGQTNVPSNLSNVVAIAGGDYFSAALNANGTVTTWGALSGSAPSGATNVVGIAAGAAHCLALKADGKVVAWGNNSDFQINVPSGLSNVIAVSAGYSQSLALKADGSIVTWGSWGGTNAPKVASKLVAIVSGAYHNAELGNRAPQADSKKFSGPANHDLVVALSGSDLNGDPLSLRLGSLPANGNLYQYDGGVRGALISAPGATVSDPLGRLIFAPGTDGYGDPFASFNYAANDGDLDSAQATITIQIIAKSYAATQPPAGFTSNSLVLAGMAVPNGMPTLAWFEWGSSTNYGFTTSATNVGAGARVVRTTAPITGLTSGGIYHYRLVASNSTAITYGANQIATTGSKVTGWGNNLVGETNIPPSLNHVVAIAGGGFHNVALKSDGTITAWGGDPAYGNDSYVTNFPSQLSNVTAVAAGRWHSLALTTDGIVVPWGFNSHGQTNPPIGLTNVIAVACGYNHSLALTSDGTVAAWGYNGNGETNVPFGLSNIVAIAAGNNHNLALKADGTLVSWSYGGYGLTNMPASLSNVVAVAAGDLHSLGLNADGRVVAWGDNSLKQTNVPAGLSNVQSIACGRNFSLALLANGSIVGWGSSAEQTNAPIGLSTVAAVDCGEYHGLALANLPPHTKSVVATGPANTDILLVLQAADANGDPLSLRIISLPSAGTLYQYATNGRGAPITSPQTDVADPAGRVIFALFTNQFGSPYTSFNFVANDGDVDSSPGTVTINILGELRVATQPAWVTATNAATLNGMVLPNGFPALAWFEWGTDASYGQMSAPASVGNGGRVMSVSEAISNLAAHASYHFRLVASNANGVVRGAHQLFTTGNKVAAWGVTSFGPADVSPGLNGITTAAAGQNHSVALRANGTVHAWGGSLAQTTNVPPTATNVVAVAAYSYHTVALRADGMPVEWGYQSYGFPRAPPSATNLIAVACGSDHDVALKADGTVLTWGQYGYNQAITPAGLSNVIAVAAGGNRSLALRADGTVVTWGDNYSNWLTPPTGLTNVVALADSGSHSLALKLDGTVVAWGDNSYGATNVPPGLSNVVAIACRIGNNLALKADGQLVTWGTNGPTAIPPGLNNVAAIAASGAHNLAVGPNVSPVAIPLTASGPLNQDLVIALSGMDANGDVLTFKIVSLPAKGQLYQCNNGGRGGPILPGGTVTDSSNRVVFVPATNEFGRPYASFSFVANDSTVDSIATTVTIIITSPTWAATRAVTHSTATGATLNGVANAGHLPTTAWYEWGNSRAYGQVTVPQQLVAGNDLAWLSESITGLAAQSVYHCRLVASNAGGVALGADRVFTTGRRAVMWDDPYVGSPPVPQGPSNAVAICGGYSHMVALRNDGSLAAWGSNSDGQTAIPNNLTNVVQVAAGAYHNLALKPDGTVVAWGRNDNQQANVPFGLSGVKQVACGNYHSLALKSNGTVVAWGDNRYGQNQVPVWLTDVVAIADSMSICVALRSNGAVVAWGGGGNYASTNAPAGLTNVVDIDAGVAVRADGKVVTWGDGLTAPTNWFDIVEVDGSLAIKADSTIAGWSSGTVHPIAARFTNVAVIAGTHILAAIGNLPPAVLPQNLKGAANQDFTIELKATDPQDDPIIFRISALPAKGSLYQFAGGGRGPPITTPDTPVTDVQNRVVYAPAPDEYNSPYTTFGYIARDVELDSTQAVVTVSIIGTPYAVTHRPAPVGPTNAVLNGMVVPNGFATRAWFEWGTNVAFGQTTTPADVGNGASVVRVSAPVDGLASNAVVHFRLVASNAASITYGARQLLTTGRRLTAWGGNGYGQTNVSWSLKGVSGVATDFGTSYALRTDGTIVASGYGATNNLPVLSNVVSIGNGIALKSDGTVVVWGSNSYGETNVPTGLNNVVAISSSGGPHRLALRADGTVVAWGDNRYGQTNVPTGLSNVVAISSGNWFSAALIADGTVVAWGGNTSVETNVPVNVSNVVAITSGSFHSLALKADGRVVTWGNNSNGSQQAVVPSDLSNVVAIACGYFHNLALKDDGTVVMWGFNVDGALNKPSWLSNVVAVAAGTYHSVVLRPNRVPSANSQSRSGVANQDQIITLGGSDQDFDTLTFRITSFPALGSLYRYSGGGRGALITTNNPIVTGSTLVFAPDTNTFGTPYTSFGFVAGDGETDSSPATVSVSISGTAYAATLAPGPVTTSNATLRGMALSSGLQSLAWFEWGTNSAYGQTTMPMPFNNGGSVATLSASLTGLIARTEYHYRLVVSNVTRVAAGGDQSFLTGGKIASWGQGIYGLTNVPAGLSNVIAVAGGSTHSLALRSDGTVKAWGGGDFYTGTNFLNVPLNLTNAIAVAAGNTFSAAVRSNGTVVAWGSSSSVTNVPSNATNVVALASGNTYLLALRNNGTLVTWGGGPSVPSGLSNVVAVAAGVSHNLGLKIDGTVVAWGDNSSGQCNVPANLTNMIAVAAGYARSMALRSDGVLIGWGSPPTPTGLSNVVKVAAGSYHTLALKANGSLFIWGDNSYGQTNPPANLGRVVEMDGGTYHSLVVGDNVPPIAQSRTVSGFANTDQILGLTGFDSNGDPLTFRVSAMPLVGKLYQFNAGNRGPLIAAPATIMDVSNRVIFVPSPNESGSPYSSFNVVVNDGETDSAVATITVNVTVPPAPQLSSVKSGAIKISAPSLSATTPGGTGGNFGLRFMGYSNLTYHVWASTNLVNWILLGSPNVTSNGWFQFVDADATNWPRRFYRISMPTDRAYNLNFTGRSNASYRVWASTNLANWELLGTASVTSNGWFQFLDFDNAKWPQRFYRAGAP